MSLAVALVVVVLGGSRSDHASLRFTRVRSSEPYINELIHEGYARSAAFRGLVDVLQHSNVVVSIHPLACAGGRIRSCLVAVEGSSRERHIWIKVDPQHTIKDRLIATIAHELQHAVEIAERPDVFDASSMLQLYRRISIGECGRGVSEECETVRALDTEKRVIEELSGKSRK